MKKTVVLIATVAASLFAMTFVAEAVDLPSYAASGDLKSQLETKGGNITKIIAGISVMVCIIGIIVGAIKIGSGDADGGKRIAIGAVIGLIITGVAYGIAALALK